LSNKAEVHLKKCLISAYGQQETLAMGPKTKPPVIDGSFQGAPYDSEKVKN
jgi:hypothetical protein